MQRVHAATSQQACPRSTGYKCAMHGTNIYTCATITYCNMMMMMINQLHRI